MSLLPTGQPARTQEDAEMGTGSAASEAGSCDDTRPVTSATLTFVDLAGSERVSTAALEDANQRTRLLEVCITAVICLSAGRIQL